MPANVPAPPPAGAAAAAGKIAATPQAPPPGSASPPAGPRHADAALPASAVPGPQPAVAPAGAPAAASPAPAPETRGLPDGSVQTGAEPTAAFPVPPSAAVPEGAGADTPPARPQGAEPPFWFFIPFPGERAPLLFPGYREQRRGEAPADWRLFFRLPDIGAISVRFRPDAGGWSILFEIEHEGMGDLLEAGAPDFSAALRDRGFPLREVLVRTLRRGAAESEFGAMLSRETGLALFEERA
jgi:hypothetical protein